MPTRSDLSKQHLLAHQHGEATGTSLRITIRFVLQLTTVFQYDTICQATAKFIRKLD